MIGILGMWADDGDDNNDKWRFVASAGGQFSLQSKLLAQTNRIGYTFL